MQELLREQAKRLCGEQLTTTDPRSRRTGEQREAISGAGEPAPASDTRRGGSVSAVVQPSQQQQQKQRSDATAAAQPSGSAGPSDEGQQPQQLPEPQAAPAASQPSAAEAPQQCSGLPAATYTAAAATAAAAAPRSEARRVIPEAKLQVVQRPAPPQARQSLNRSWRRSSRHGLSLHGPAQCCRTSSGSSHPDSKSSGRTDGRCL